MFHHITDDYVDTELSCVCGTEVFSRFIKEKLEEGYSFVTIEKAFYLLRSNNPSKFIVLTFDDIPETVFTNAYPVLKEFSIPFIVFVSPGLINTPGYVTDQELRIMGDDCLCTIGAHTMTHPFLRKCKNSFEEIINSKEYLETLIKREVLYFAYPYGKTSSVSWRNICEAKRAGFRYSFGTINSPITSISSLFKYYLPRKTI